MMRCPRCGWDNDPRVAACVRCALPVPGRSPQAPPPQPAAGQPYGATQSEPTPYGATQPSPPVYQRRTEPPPSAAPGWPPPQATSQPSTRPPANPSTAILVMLVAFVFTVGYGAWSLTLRREIFADYATGVSVSTEVARSNDRIDLALVLVTAVTAIAAIVLWWTALRRRPRTTLGVLGLVVTAAAVLVALVGLAIASSVSGVDGQTGQGDRGVAASVVTGTGFLLLGCGLMCGALGLRDRDRSRGRRRSPERS